MLVGNKNTFALEFEFDEFFDNDFIAFGTYRLYINGFCYGEKSPEHSWFGGVVYGFKKILKERKDFNNFFELYSNEEIAENYWQYFYNEFINERKSKQFLGIIGDDFGKLFFDLRDYAEAHFDDSSFVLMFRNFEEVKLIGFQVPKIAENEKGVFENINSITIPRKSFDCLINNALDFILSERDKAVKKEKFNAKGEFE
jgi:hypothetical protein